MECDSTEYGSLTEYTGMSRIHVLDVWLHLAKNNYVDVHCDYL